MVEFIVAVVVIALIAYYLSRNKKASQNGGSEISKTSNLQDIQENKIVHESLSAKQVNRITEIQQALIEVNNTSLEDTIENFKRDANPDNEIEIWEAIAGTYQQVIKATPKAPLAEKQEIYNLLLMRSMMSNDEVLSQSNLTTISKEKATGILNQYNLEEKPFIVVRK